MKKSSITIDLQNDSGITGIPSIEQIERWVVQSLQSDYAQLCFALPADGDCSKGWSDKFSEKISVHPQVGRGLAGSNETREYGAIAHMVFGRH